MVKIDKETCIGCGACANAYPDLFEMNEGKADVKKQPSSGEEKKQAKEAVELCPVQAIST